MEKSSKNHGKIAGKLCKNRGKSGKNHGKIAENPRKITENPEWIVAQGAKIPTYRVDRTSSVDFVGNRPWKILDEQYFEFGVKFW